jgi:hypothetical protein
MMFLLSPMPWETRPSAPASTKVLTKYSFYVTPIAHRPIKAEDIATQ